MKCHLSEKIATFAVAMTKRGLRLILVACSVSIWLLPFPSTGGIPKGCFWFINRDPDSGVVAPISQANGELLDGTNYLAMLYYGTSSNSLVATTISRPFKTGTRR